MRLHKFWAHGPRAPHMGRRDDKVNALLAEASLCPKPKAKLSKGHTRIHAYIHTYTYTYAQAYTYAHAHTYAHTYGVGGEG